MEAAESVSEPCLWAAAGPPHTGLGGVAITNYLNPSRTVGISTSPHSLEITHFVSGFRLPTKNVLPADLLMEHIQEIRSLRKRLEESIKTNEKLRRQLERQGSEFDQGKKDLPKASASR